MKLDVGVRVEINESFLIGPRVGQRGVIAARFSTLRLIESAGAVLAYGAQSAGGPWYRIAFDARFSGDNSLYAQSQLRAIEQ
jgi:hypothetical protein